MIQVWFDGCCKGNPYGKGGIGVVIKRDGKIIHTVSQYIGQGVNMSCNVAEHKALQTALIYLKDQGLTDERIEVRGDSSLVVDQMSGRRRIKKGIYKNTALKTKELLKCFTNLSSYWISRDKNTQADELTNLGIKLHQEEKRVIFI